MKGSKNDANDADGMFSEGEREPLQQERIVRCALDEIVSSDVRYAVEAIVGRVSREAAHWAGYPTKLILSGHNRETIRKEEVYKQRDGVVPAFVHGVKNGCARKIVMEEMNI